MQATAAYLNSTHYVGFLPDLPARFARSSRSGAPPCITLNRVFPSSRLHRSRGFLRTAGGDIRAEEPAATATPTGAERTVGTGPVAVEAPDGTTYCVDPVESEESVEAFYGFDDEGEFGANVPPEPTEND